MQNNSIIEFKIKANEFIEDYQRQVTQRQYQKQKLKQNIMLEIMSNRHKSQASQSSFANDLDRIQTMSLEAKFKKSIAMPASQIRNLSQNNKDYDPLMRSNSVPNVIRDMSILVQQKEQKPQLQSAQITFKMSKNRNFQNYSSKQQQKSIVSEQNQQQQSNFMDKNQTLREQKYKFSKPIEPNEQLIKNKSKINGHSSQYKQNENYKNFKHQQSKIKTQSQSEYQTQRKQLIQQQIQQIQQNAPIFLTVDEDQSVQVSRQKNKNKNYAFDIAMDKSQPVQDIQELRRRKIQQMEKKRQQRMEQFKKQQQAKKQINNQQKDSKRSSSVIRGSNKAISGQNMRDSKIDDEIQTQISKSRSKRKLVAGRQQRQNLSSQNIIQQSHYNMKPPQQQKSSYINTSEREKQRIEIQTPKTIYSEYRNDKSRGKNTIFRQSPRRDKSGSKYSQDPKIQPKDRKNTFVKQSNKKLMITAINNTCLPGELNRKQRQKLTQVIEKQTAQFFVLLFKEYSRKVIKAIYILDSSQACLQKIYGEKAPQQIVSDNVQYFYRFDSGSRQFKKLDGCKSFSLVVHAIDLA